MVLSFCALCARKIAVRREKGSFFALYTCSPSSVTQKIKKRVVEVNNVVLLDILLLRVRLGQCCTGLYHGLVLGNKF